MSWRNMLAIPKQLFPNVIGIDDDSDNWIKIAKLSEGGVDPRTGGAVVVTSETKFDEENKILNLLTHYWRMRPNGEHLMQNLFDVEFVETDFGGIAPKSIWIMGRKLYEADDKEVAVGAALNINRALSAIQSIHRDIRTGELPQIAKIFKETGLQESIGENLPIVGLGKAGGFDFSVYDKSSLSASPLILPKDVVKPLLGLGENTLDAHQRLDKPRTTTATSSTHGTQFAAYVAPHKGSDTFRISSRLDPVNILPGRHAYSIPQLIETEWKESARNNTTLEELKFLGVDIMKADPTTRMQIISITNKIMHAVRRREYPAIIDYLIESDMHDWAETTDAPPKRGRMIVESRGGNNMEEIADGYGNQINGNCKYIEVQWLDDNEQIQKLGAIHDLGLFLPATDEPNRGAAADVVNQLKNVTHLFFTHRHLDHTDGAIVYIAKGYFKNKIIHASPECIRSLREKLATYEIPKEYYPTFVPLKGKGWFHLKDAQGVTRLSVGYSTDGTPHTARCTPLIYVARNGSEVLGSYMNHGDARYGEHNADDYTGFKPDSDYLDKDFFQNALTNLANDDSTVDQSIRGRRATLADFDITSIRQQGWSPPDWQIEDNLTEALGWFDDLGVVMAQISTNETRFESAQRIATRLRRDLTEFGANIEHTATTANVMGVNKLRLAPEEKQNIQRYLDYYDMQLSQERLAALQEKLQKTPKHKHKKRNELKEEIECEERVQNYSAKLNDMKSQYKRYKKRDEYEALLHHAFGGDHLLGSVRVTRNTHTSKEIFKSRPHRRFVLVTGTQGNFVEIDATLYRLSEGRSLFDFKPETKHTARPLKPSENIICISQSAIPGNEKKQRELVDRLVLRGFIVMVAVRGGMEIHNLNPVRKKKIVADLKAKNRDFTEQQDGTLAIYHMPIHAPGHGYEDDAKAWLDLTRADFSAPQHTADPMAVKRFGELSEAGGHRHANRIFENFERILVEMGNTPAESVVKTIGRSIPSIILIEVIRKIREYYGGHIEAERVVKLDGQGGLREDGLMASAKPNGVYRQHFATVNGENARKKAAARKATRPEPIPFNRSPPLPERRYAGPQRPGAHRRTMPMRVGERIRIV